MTILKLKANHAIHNYASFEVQITNARVSVFQGSPVYSSDYENLEFYFYYYNLTLAKRIAISSALWEAEETGKSIKITLRNAKGAPMAQVQMHRFMNVTSKEDIKSCAKARHALRFICKAKPPATT